MMYSRTAHWRPTDIAPMHLLTMVFKRKPTICHNKGSTEDIARSEIQKGQCGPIPSTRRSCNIAINRMRVRSDFRRLGGGRSEVLIRNHSFICFFILIYFILSIVSTKMNQCFPSYSFLESI